MAEMVTLPKELAEAVAGEIRAWSGHWLERYAVHDHRMADGSCCTCVLLDELDARIRGVTFEDQPYDGSPAGDEHQSQHDGITGDMGTHIE